MEPIKTDCIGCDAHRRYSVFVVMDEKGHTGKETRVEHSRELYRHFLNTLPRGSPIALESIGNWYWMIEEMERAGHQPMLAHAKKAKLMMGLTNKTDKLDARGLALLLRNGTLPSVWIPPGQLRDQRELPRTRMVFGRMRTMLKNRIQSTLAKYGIQIDEVRDLFGVTGRGLLQKRLNEMPQETQRSIQQHLTLLDGVLEQIEGTEKRIKEVIKETPQMQLLMTLPGVGPILAIVIMLEIGDIERFPDAPHLASYAGTVPQVKSSGGKTYYGRVRPDVNRYLKWAFIEAANSIVVHQRRMSHRHVVQLYHRVMKRKGHPKAIVAVARHLAEATYWMLTRKEAYREPSTSRSISPTQK
jgi:transposase